jgi:hypothetical protein
LHGPPSQKEKYPSREETTPAKKLTFAEAAIAAMEDKGQEEGQGESEREE